MDKKPQMMICPKAKECGEPYCIHKVPHEENDTCEYLICSTSACIPYVEPSPKDKVLAGTRRCRKYGYSKASKCIQAISPINGCADCPEWQLVEPSPEPMPLIECNAEWDKANCLDKSTCPILSDGSYCTHTKPKCPICNGTGMNPEGILRNCSEVKCSCQDVSPLRAEMLKVCSNCTLSEGCSQCPVEQAMCLAQAWLPLHDQQVRKDFAEECIKTMPIPVEGKRFQAQYRAWQQMVAHLRAMAEKE